MPPRLLVVEDDDHIRTALRWALEDEGYTVEEAVSGEEACFRVDTAPPDVMVLDLMLGRMDGFGVVRHVRRAHDLPIIVVSARADTSDIETALDAGADDYVTKPFGVDELMARLRAAVRRAATSPETENGPLDAGELSIDLVARIVRRSGEEVHLTPTEWSVLDLLVRNRGKLVSRKQLLREIWGPVERKETSYLRVYMAQLRRKLERDPAHPEHLITEAGMGYRFRA